MRNVRNSFFNPPFYVIDNRLDKFGNNPFLREKVGGIEFCGADFQNVAVFQKFSNAEFEVLKIWNISIALHNRRARIASGDNVAF